MKKQLINIIAATLPRREWRRSFRRKYLEPNPSVVLFHNTYKKNFPYDRIYAPIYNSRAQLSTQTPELYNKYGERLHTYFIRDAQMAHVPYNNGRYIFFDRFNIGLDTHFYTHECMLETMGKPTKKYGWLIESESILPYDYTIFERHPGLHKDFDAIFTYSEKLLDTYENAKFLPGCSVGYGTTVGGGALREDAHAHKTKNISMLSSAKATSEMHRIRKNLAQQLAAKNFVDTYGNFAGGPGIPFVADVLTDYRYSIAIENEISPLYFTEKITNCFAAMTVPIYVGATAIDQFFNPDGIIQVRKEDIGNIDTILKQCAPADYESRLPAIKDNYRRVQQYFTPEDYLFENYLQKEEK